MASPGTAAPRSSTPDVPSTVPRLALRAEGSRGGPVDGAWWPRSTSLVTELSPLLVELHRRGIRITRANYHRSGWAQGPHSFRADGDRTIHLGWFRGIDPHLLRLRGVDGERLDLLVVPVGTPPGVAGRVLAAAGGDARAASPTALLAAAGTLSAADAPGPAAAWVSEGGRPGRTDS